MSKKIQRVVSITTSLTTILWMSGVATLAPIASVSAAQATSADLADGDTIRATGGIDVYIVKLIGEKKFRRLILNPEVFESYGHLSWAKVKEVSQATMDEYTVSEIVKPENDYKVYKLIPDGDTGTKQHLNMTAAEFGAAGYDWDSIYIINAIDAGNYNTGSDILAGETSAPSTGLAVALASDSPAAGAVAIGSVDKEFAKIKLTAGTDKAYTITSIAVRRSGISNDTDVSAVKLYNGATQVGSTQAINTTTHKATFGAINLVVGAGSTATLTVKGSISTSAPTSSQIILGIESASDVATDVTPSGSFPVNSAAQTVAGLAVGNAIVVAQTSPSGNLLSGSTDQHVASFKFTASSTEGVIINRIKLTESGTSSDPDTTNIKLKISGAQIGSTVAGLSNATAEFNLSSAPISILAGGSKTVDVYADIAPGINTSRGVQFAINNAIDVDVVGVNTNGGITLQNSFAQSGQTLTVNQGSFTVALDTATNPSAQTFVKGTSNNTMTVLKFSAGANEGIRVVGLKLTLTGSSAAATDVSNVSIYDNGTTSGGAGTLIATGAVVGTTIQFGSSSNNSAYDATGLFDVAASVNRYITVKADVPTGATAAHTIGFKVNAVGDVLIDGLSSQNDIASNATNITLNSPNGNNHTIAANGSLSVSLSANTPSAQTVSKNTSGLTFTQIDFTASSEDINLTTVVIRSYVGSGTGVEAVGTGTTTNVKLMDGANQLGSTCVNTASNGSCTFTFSKTIPKNQTLTLSVVGDIPTGAGASSIHWDLPSKETIADDITSSGASSGADLTETGGATGNLFTIGVPTLTVAVSATPAATTFVKNAIDAKVLTLLLTAGSSEDITVSSIKIMGATTSTELTGAGTVAGATTTNVKLYDGETQVGNPGAFIAGTYSTTADYVNFTSLGLTVLKGTTKQIDVKLTVGGSNSIYYFGVSTTSDVVSSGKSSGASATVTLSATPSMGAGMTFTSAGTLAVDDAADTPTNAIVAVGGSGQTSSEVIVRQIKFTATNEPIALTNINLYRVLGDNNGANYQSVSLYNKSTLIATTYLTPTTSPESEVNFDLSALGKEQTVPKNKDLTLTVKATFNGTDNTTSGTSTTLGLHSAGNIRGRGLDSHTVNIAPTVASGALSTTGTAKALVLKKSKPTLTTVAVSGSIGGLSSGTKTLYKFSVTADSKADISWNRVMFYISGYIDGKPLGLNDNIATLADASIAGIYHIDSKSAGSSTTADSVAVNNFKFYDAGSSTQISNGTFYYRTARNHGTVGLEANESASGSQNTGSGWYVSFVKTSANSEEAVAAGSTKTYELRGDVVGSPGSGSSIVTNIQQISSVATDANSVITTSNTYAQVVTSTGLLYTGMLFDVTIATSTPGVGSTSTPSFVWSDKSASSHSTSTTDWTNDYLVPGLPTDTVTWSL